MASSEAERKLTAVFVTDVVGYSRLMGDDHDDTVKTLSEYRAVFTDYIQQHKGRVVNAPGDSILAEFGSVVDAVSCAVEIQQELAERNQKLPDQRRMDFRIGVNLGDVLIKDGELFGDGVNIAARLESLAESGGVCISRTVYDQVHTRLDLDYEYLGEHTVKNIAEPVRAYKVSLKSTASASPTPTTPDAVSKGRAQPSIAVLPFVNMSGDPEQEYFSDGITEDLITALSNISRLSVVSRNSVFAYKGQSLNAKRIGEELGVSHIVEGSVRKAGNRVRITAQLIDCSTDYHLWSERYDRTLEDVFAVQDEITNNVVMALNVALLDGDQALKWRNTKQNPEVYYLFLRGRHAWQSDPNRKTLEEAERMWTRCVELDPEYARAYSGLAGAKVVRVGWLGERDDRLLEDAEEYARRAVDLEENLAHAHTMLGQALWYKQQFDEALTAFKRALQLDPEGPQTLRTYALTLVYDGKWSEAEKAISKSISGIPSPTSYQLFVSGLAHLMGGRNEEAIRDLNDVASKGSDFLALHLVLTAAYAGAKRMADAEAQVGEILRVDPSYVVAERAPLMFRFRDSTNLEQVMTLLRKAGLPE